MSLVVPEGFIVRRYTGEDSESYAVVRPAHVDGPSDALSVAFHSSASPNSLREDYASSDESARTMRGRVAGRDVSLLELVAPSRRRLVGRLELPTAVIDVVVDSTTDAVRAQFESAVANAVLRDPDAEESGPSDDEDATGRVYESPMP